MTAGSTGASPRRAAQGRAAPHGTPQQRRTRRAIVTAAMQLLRDGGPTPTIDQIAAAAEVARRTIYLHFPTLDHLLLDATAGLLSETDVAEGLDPAVHGQDVAARVATLAQKLCDPTTLPLGRQIIALTVTAAPSDEPLKRGYRRLDWIERAVQPLRPRLTDEQHHRLVAALAVCLGWESMIVLRDICGLDEQHERAVVTWLADTVIHAMIEEADSTGTA
ncbi:MAG: TetR/AcrR family transcriptional regulator [Pseudonocardia sp.]|nr:TetR/AcrR family transcriptional regulator [Pseudonocardia sp.]